MAAVILPSEVEYQPFADEQIASFANAAGREYANPDRAWRADLDDAAKELLIEYASNDWPTPSALRKRLAAVKNNPDKFIRCLANNAELRESPEATAILHGARWQPDQLARAGECRDQFIAGVEREIKWLDLIIKRRKEMGVTGHTGDAAMKWFIDQLVCIYRDAFLQEANVGLSVPSPSSRKLSWDAAPSGPFINFTQAVMNAIEENLPVALRNSQVPKELRAFSSNAIRNCLERSSENYNLAKLLGKFDQGFTYPVTLTADENGGYVVTCRDVPEVVTQGETIEEAISEAEGALEAAIEKRMEDGMKIPPPTVGKHGEHLANLPINTAMKAATYIFKI